MSSLDRVADGQPSFEGTQAFSKTSNGHDESIARTSPPGSIESLAGGPTTAERLGGGLTTAEKLAGRQASTNDRWEPEVVRTTTTSNERRADTTREDFESDRRIYTAGAVVGTAVTGNPLAVAVAGLATYVVTTLTTSERTEETTVTEGGTTTWETSGDERNGNNEIVSSTTTRTAEYDDGTIETSVFDSTSGIERATVENGRGVTTAVSITRPDTDAANSPRTTTTRDEDGNLVGMTVTSPTGGVYEVAVDTPADPAILPEEPVPEPEPARSPPPPPRNSMRSDSDNNSGGSGYSAPSSTTGNSGMHGGGT